ncbi:uncharacterized protein LOC135101179 isoform X4 [Scylla paramamosain]|uniref:uncharacterized protein LOC135100094 isoform X4 n=1 Tax=Scylla paramamosain TaxID=85552 RepID=UPI003082B26A
MLSSLPAPAIDSVKFSLSYIIIQSSEDSQQYQSDTNKNGQSPCYVQQAQRIPNNSSYQIPTRMDSHLALSNRLLQKQGTASPVHHRRHCYWAAKKIHPSGRYLTTVCRRCVSQA